MSEENVEAFKRGIVAYNRRDIEALLETLDPEVEWHPALEIVLGGDAAYRGHAGVHEMLRTVEEALDSLQVEFFDVRDLGNRLVARGRMRARGKESGAETESPVGYLADFRNGKALRIRTYLDPEEALEAAGLRE